MKYLATINVPGYLPMDDDPPTFDTARDAWQYLAEERQRAEDDALDLSVGFGEQDEGYSATVNTMERLAEGDFQPEFGVNDDGTGWVHGDTPGYDGDHDLGLAYHVSIVEDHAHYLVDVSKEGVPGVDSFICAGVSLWTQDRDEVHEFIAEAREQGYSLSHRIVVRRLDYPASECECAHSSAARPTIVSSSRGE